MRVLTTSVLWASLVCLCETAALAGEPSSEPSVPAPQMSAVAQRHFDDAVAFYQAGNYDAAQIEFKAAYDLSRLPDLLHNLGLVAERQGRYAEAIALEERCLVEKGSSVTVPEQDEARGRIARLRELLAQQAQPAGRASGTTKQPSAGSPPGDTRRRPRAAVALLGVGSGLLLAGIACGAGALATQAQASGSGPFFVDEYDGLLNRGRALEKSAISLSVVGGVVAASGAGWLIWQRTRSRRLEQQTAMNPSGWMAAVESSALDLRGALWLAR